MSENKKLPKLLVLELTDPQVNALFAQMKNIINGRNTSSAVHVTLRGPYSSNIPKSQIDSYREMLRGKPIRIYAAGRFHNPQEEVVFFRVDAPELQKLWWKKDFPKKKYGFHPHVSIYRGPNVVFADELERFLTQENLDLFVKDYKFATKTLNQPDLFTINYDETPDLNKLSMQGTISPAFLKRLRDLLQNVCPANSLTSTSTTLEPIQPRVYST